MQKRLLPIFAVVMLLAGCTSSSTENEQAAADRNTFQFQLHANVEHGVNQKVIAFTKIDTLFHLFYSTGSNEWGRLISSDLQHWQSSSSLEMEDKAPGVLAFDPERTKGAPDVWNRLQNVEGEIMLATSPEGNEWKASQLNPVLKTNPGAIRHSWDPVSSSWLLTLTTTPGTVEIFRSQDLQNWQPAGSITTAEPFTSAAVYPIQQQWLLLTEGKSLVFHELTYANDEFIIENDAAHSQYFGRTSGIIWSNQGTHVLLSSNEEASQKAVPTFALPLTVSCNMNRIRFNQTPQLKENTVAKRRGLMSQLIPVGAFHISTTLQHAKEEIRWDFITDSTRTASLFINLKNQQITLDRSLAPVGDSQSLMYPFLADTSSLKIDVIVDYNTIDLLVDDGATFSGSFHTGKNVPTDAVRIYVDGSAVNPPGTLLTFEK